MGLILEIGIIQCPDELFAYDQIGMLPGCLNNDLQVKEEFLGSQSSDLGRLSSPLEISQFVPDYVELIEYSTQLPGG
ncbi:hypothetical protein C627_02005 [Corynebacterium glutamicum ZL-6]|nr:hypothetical protein C627_02005 [Corynebacterium glutamicum ZL-6]